MSDSETKDGEEEERATNIGSLVVLDNTAYENKRRTSQLTGEGTYRELITHRELAR